MGQGGYIHAPTSMTQHTFSIRQTRIQSLPMPLTSRVNLDKPLPCLGPHLHHL